MKTNDKFYLFKHGTMNNPFLCVAKSGPDARVKATQYYRDLNHTIQKSSTKLSDVLPVTTASDRDNAAVP